MEKSFPGCFFISGRVDLKLAHSVQRCVSSLRRRHRRRRRRRCRHRRRRRHRRSVGKPSKEIAVLEVVLYGGRTVPKIKRLHA